jgi:hypothetical protein
VRAAAAPRGDRLVALLLFAGALGLYAATLLPGIGSGDTAEFQRVLPTLGVAHPTGYPLYTILGWLWSWLPLGTPAWRTSLFSAFTAALAVAALYVVARALGQARGVAAAAALALACSRTFWSQATVAEVYALAALIQALLLLALLRWRAGRWPLWLAGLMIGLGLAHHRTIVLMIPGALLFVLISHGEHSEHRENSVGTASAEPSVPLVAKTDLARALAAILGGCLLYLYLPLRAPDWLDSWATFARVVAGSDALSVWLHVGEPGRVALEHLRELATRLIWPQVTPAGALLALAGLARVWWRDRALAALLTLGYLLALVFCVLFFVQDVEVFLISGHLIAALLLGEGAMGLLSLVERLFSSKQRDKETKRQGDEETRGQGDKGTRRQGDKETKISRSPGLPVSLSPSRWQNFSSWAAPLFLLIPVLLLWSNLPGIRAANTRATDLAARALLAQPLPRGALLIADWEAVEGLRYLQAIEGLRPDVEVRPLNESVVRQDVDAALAAGRATYLLRAQPNLGLAQRPEGRVWRVSNRPLGVIPAKALLRQWSDGINLLGYTLPPGPYRPGDIVPVTLLWEARATPRGRYTLFVHLVGPDGALWGQHDREPQPTPTDQWPATARFTDLYGPTLPIDTPPGRYDVVVGWYSYPSLERLPLAGTGADALTLGQIEVVPLR